MTSRALSLLAALASPVFLAAAVAGWALGVWPATPATFTVAALVVASGPLLGIYHVAVDQRDDEDGYIDAEFVEEETLIVAPQLAPLPLTRKAAEARAFTNWRNAPNAVIAERDRERRANAYLRT